MHAETIEREIITMKEELRSMQLLISQNVKHGNRNDRNRLSETDQPDAT